MIINCTPHDIDLYAPDTPDVLPSGHRRLPVAVIPVSGTVVRIVERLREYRRTAGAESVPAVAFVEFGHVVRLPERSPETWYVVSLACALAVPQRTDLLVPWRQVRNPAGTVIGCRALARPITTDF